MFYWQLGVKIMKAFSPYLEDTIEINIGIVEALKCKLEMSLKHHIYNKSRAKMALGSSGHSPEPRWMLELLLQRLLNNMLGLGTPKTKSHMQR